MNTSIYTVSVVTENGSGNGNEVIKKMGMGIKSGYGNGMG